MCESCPLLLLLQCRHFKAPCLQAAQAAAEAPAHSQGACCAVLAHSQAQQQKQWLACGPTAARICRACLVHGRVLLHQLVLPSSSCGLHLLSRVSAGRAVDARVQHARLDVEMLMHCTAGCCISTREVSQCYGKDTCTLAALFAARLPCECMCTCAFVQTSVPTRHVMLLQPVAAVPAMAQCRSRS